MLSRVACRVRPAMPRAAAAMAVGLSFSRGSMLQARFKSSISQEIEHVGEKIEHAAEHVGEAAGNMLSGAPSADILAQAAAATNYLPEHVGYFQQVGLATSWVWPTGFFQHVFELAHVFSGFPWWATILAVTLGLRCVMLPLYISASDATARMARIKPELTKLMEKTKQATDQVEIQKAMLARKQIMTKNNVKMFSMIKPILAVPIFLGVFGALSGMAKVPIPGMTTEGLFWFTNLAAADPYCGLQIITACLYSLTFRLFGGETGSANMTPVMKKLFTWMPFIAIPFTMSLPAGVCYYFAINAIFSIVQSNALKMPLVRNKLGLAPMMTPEEQKKVDAEVAKTQSSTIMGAMRQKYDDAKLQAEKKVAAEAKASQEAADRAAAEAKRFVQIKKRKN